MEPDPDDLPKILKKIEFGLADEPAKDRAGCGRRAGRRPSPPRRLPRRRRMRRRAPRAAASIAQLGDARLWRAPAKVNLTLHVLGAARRRMA